MRTVNREIRDLVVNWRPAKRKTEVTFQNRPLTHFGFGALTSFASEHPGADLQKIRALIRSARQERAHSRPPRAYRELFRVLKDVDAAKTLPG